MEDLIKRILEKENIVFKKIEKSDSGFTNVVYFIDDKFVLKILSPSSKREKILKEIDVYKNVSCEFMPKFVASGNFDDVDYLIIEKLEGKSLYSVWPDLTKQQRKSAVLQIADILNRFHKEKGDFLQEKFIQTDAVKKWNRSFDLNIDILNKKGFDTRLLREFQKTRLKEVFAEQKNGLVYNDAHFDNFIYNDGKLFLIDFDRVLYCSIDYELLIIKQMVDNPKKFANENDELRVKIEDYEDVYPLLKKHAKEMFDFKYIDERVFIYQFFYNLGHGYEYDRRDWIENELAKFENYFL